MHDFPSAVIWVKTKTGNIKKTMKKLHEHYPGAVEQTVAGLIQLAAEEACMGKSPLSTYMVLADIAEEYGFLFIPGPPDCQDYHTILHCSRYTCFCQQKAFRLRCRF